MALGNAYHAIVHAHYGAPSEVLQRVDRAVADLVIGEGDVLIEISMFPIHPGDLHMIRGDSNGGPTSPIDPQKLRGPGFEGVGKVLQIGDKAEKGSLVKVGDRVAFFFGGARAWATHTVVPVGSVVALPDSMPDSIAAQLLVNSITALVALKAGHNSLPKDFQQPVFALQTAAASSVNRLITQIAVDRGVKPILLVRSASGAQVLRDKQPNMPVFSTDDTGWKAKVKGLIGTRPLHVVMDAVGGELINDLAEVITPGGTIISYGWLGHGAPDLSILAPRELTISGITMGSWATKNDASARAADIKTAIDVASRHPEIFEVAADYSFAQIQEAIEDVSKPGKSGIVLVSNLIHSEGSL